MLARDPTNLAIFPEVRRCRFLHISLTPRVESTWLSTARIFLKVHPLSKVLVSTANLHPYDAEQAKCAELDAGIERAVGGMLAHRQERADGDGRRSQLEVALGEAAERAAELERARRDLNADRARLEDAAAELAHEAAAVRRCKVDPNLKAPGF